MARPLLFSLSLLTLCAISTAINYNYGSANKRAEEELPALGLTEDETISLVDYLLTSLRNQKVERRGHADFGLMSRHFAGSDYARASEANTIAQNPFGPGRRKRQS